MCSLGRGKGNCIQDFSRGNGSGSGTSSMAGFDSTRVELSWYVITYLSLLLLH
jgi:hypothetical protein